MPHARIASIDCVQVLTSEADARINIDQLLRDAGWDPADKQQVTTEAPITVDLNEISSEFSSKLSDDAPSLVFTEEG